MALPLGQAYVGLLCSTNTAPSCEFSSHLSFIGILFLTLHCVSGLSMATSIEFEEASNLSIHLIL